jgi:hypothetical protein
MIIVLPFGGIGRHDGLKIHCPLGCIGSIPIMDKLKVKVEWLSGLRRWLAKLM